jgi:hypothetical protein
MRLDMVQGNSFTVEEALERPYLVDGDCRELLWRELHLPTTEPLQVWKTRVSTDSNIVSFATSHRLHHNERIAPVESAGNIGDIDHGEELEVRTTGPIPVL